MKFPIYLKHADNSVFYELCSLDHFKECKRLGSSKYPLPDKYIYTEVSNGDYPTSLYINDLIIALKNGHLVEISSSEFHEIRSLGE